MGSSSFRSDLREIHNLEERKKLTLQPTEDMIVYDLSAKLSGVREMGDAERFEKKNAAFEAGQFMWKVSKKLAEMVESGELLPNEQITITVTNRTSL